MGKEYKQYGLGRLVSPFDKRDYNLANFIPLTAPVTLQTNVKWEFPAESLDQGETPHCVGFGGAGFGINLPVNTQYTNQDGHDFYYKCKVIDGNPGSEEGSYVRSIAKVLQQEGRIEHYAFAHNIDAIKWWLFQKGPVIVGTIWTEEMFTPDKDNIITIGGNVVGGHGYLINGIKDNKFFRLQNSWGENWGDNGSAYILIEDFEKIFIYGGEAMAAVELPNPQEIIEKPKGKCFLVDFIESLFA